ncbi:MAG: hypothetical protein NTZ90_03700 [Proteobacteria bacterium]|nr:hypothetical protein [Pseudomonadota bacterium]
MKLSKWIVAGVMAGLSGSYTALAEDEASFTFHLPVLNYSSASSSAKNSSSSPSTKTTKTTSTSKTNDLSGSYLEASWGKANLYVYPFNASSIVSPSYMVKDNLELGLDLGLNSLSINKPKETANTNVYGVWGIYYVNVSKALVIENGLNLDYTSKSGKKTVTSSAGVNSDVKTNDNTLAVKVTINAVVPLAKNVNYLGGISYEMDQEDDKEGKIKTDTGIFSVNLATVRLILK